MAEVHMIQNNEPIHPDACRKLVTFRPVICQIWWPEIHNKILFPQLDASIYY